MAKREPPRPSPKLLGLIKEFQAIAGMAGFLNHVMDPPQLRLMFTLYARVSAPTAEEVLALQPQLQAWCDRIGVDLREGSSAAILPPQVQVSNAQTLPAGGYSLIATMTFTSKVTDASYLRVRTAVLKAYKRALILREKGVDHALAHLDEVVEEPVLAEEGGEGEGLAFEPEGAEGVESEAAQPEG